jgi:NADPH:quinone reductase-like Zn-dependent oxidoreductase
MMKAIVVTDQAAGTAGMKLAERPEPQAAINDVVVQVHASGFTWDELTSIVTEHRPSLGTSWLE